MSLAPVEVLNKHNRILLYVENYRQIRSAGKRVRITSFILTEDIFLAFETKRCCFILRLWAQPCQQVDSVMI